MTRDEAADRARLEIPDGCVLLADFTRRIHGGWYFGFQTEAFARTRDVRDTLVGSGGLIVAEATGAVSNLGSGS